MFENLLIIVQRHLLFKNPCIPEMGLYVHGNASDVDRSVSQIRRQWDPVLNNGVPVLLIVHAYTNHDTLQGYLDGMPLSIANAILIVVQL